MREKTKKKILLKELITVHLCSVMLKQKWYFSFAPAMLVLWSYSPSGLDNLLLQTAFQQHIPLAYRKTPSCNRPTLATTYCMCSRRARINTLFCVPKIYNHCVCASHSKEKCSAIQQFHHLQSTGHAGMWWPFQVQPEGTRFSKVTFC